MTSDSRANTFSVGFVLFVATILVVLGLFWVGSGHGLFADQNTYVVYLPSAGGLKTGSRVHLSGVPVGAVDSIDFPADPRVNEVVVKLKVKRRVSPRIRSNSYSWLQSEGLLGDTTLHLSAGTAEAEELPPDSRIPYRARFLLDDLAGEGITESATDLLGTTMSILKDINEGQGTIGQLLKNPALYNNLSSFSDSLEKLTRDLNEVSAELRGIMDEVKSQRGALGKLIFSPEYEKEFSQAISGAAGLIRELNTLAAGLRDGRGSLGKLFANADLHDQLHEASREVSAAAAGVSRTLEQAEERGSLFARAMTDGALGEEFARLIARLEKSASSLEVVLGILERGEGSLGMLLRDPSIATSLRDVFIGVQEYGYVQRLLRNAERTGRVATLRGERTPEELRREVLRARELARLEEASRGQERHEAGKAKPVPATAQEEGGSEGEPNP